MVGNLALKPPISGVMFASTMLTVGTIQAALVRGWGLLLVERLQLSTYNLFTKPPFGAQLHLFNHLVLELKAGTHLKVGTLTLAVNVARVLA